MIWLLFACSPADVEATVTTEATSPVTSGSTSDLTYYRDVEPILATHCIRCHGGGGLGDGDLTDPATVVEKAAQIRSWVEIGLMPPPVADPTCRDYVGADHMALSESDRETILAWADGGAALGDPSDSAAVTADAPDLEDPDVEVLLEAAYTPTFADPDNPGNEYRCFVLDPETDDDLFITAMDPVIDRDDIVHHVVLLAMPREEVTPALEDPAGWDCIDGSGAEVDDMLAAWAPGMMPIEFPEGHGMHLAPDHVFVIQMHYFDSGDPGSDQSGYAFRTTDSVDTVVRMAPLGIGDFAIPAGAEGYSDGGTFENEYLDITLHGVFPHMHELGRSYSMTLQEDGAETCLVEGTYDFNNQLTYMWPDPVSFPYGSSVDFECTWDGAEDVTTYYGERTDEEMCFFFTLVSY